MDKPNIPEWKKRENTLIALTAAIGYEKAVKALNKLQSVPEEVKESE